MIGSLLATKTFLPVLQEHLVSRPRLVAHLDSGLKQNHRLFLISASAGAGKSTLLAEWVASTGLPGAWLSLDKEDNELLRFWTYITAAIRQRYPGACQEIFDSLRSAQTPPVMSILPDLVNQLAELTASGLILALDDYHLIEAPAVHESLAWLIEHLPPTVHLAIATRSDPPLPLHRWRARGQLTEVRFDDLRFTLEESEVFLNERMALGLRGDDVRQLEKRTEGWVVGLQLAAISLKGRSDPATFIARFSASHHYVLEYLTNEVLAVLQPDEQDFLMQVSILQRFSAPLCAAVSGREDSAAVLEKLWQANLFLIPLDDELCWFRFHHLFADLLQGRLKARGEAAFFQLHQRAAGWLAENMLIDEALYHALQARDVPFAAGLVNRHWRRASFEGKVRATRAWIETLPADVVAADPLLSVASAWTLFQMGQTLAVEPVVMNALRAYSRMEASGTLPADDWEYQTLPGQMAALRSMLAMRRWDLDAAVRLGEEALRLTPSGQPLATGLALMALGLVKRERGLPDESIDDFRKSIPYNRAVGNISAVGHCVLNAGRLLVIQGRIDEADALYQAAWDAAREDHQENEPSYATLHIGQSEVDYERNLLDSARERLQRGLEQGKRSGYMEFIRSAGLQQARLYRAEGDTAGAVLALQELLGVLQQVGLLVAASEAGAWLARLRAESGELDAALAWAGSVENEAVVDGGLTWGQIKVCQARVWLAAGQTEKALEQLAQMETRMRGSGSIARLAEVLVLQCQAYQQRREKGAALRALEQALLLAAPTGLIRVFLDEGEALKEAVTVLKASESIDKNPAARRLLENLLDAFSAAPGTPPAHSVESTSDKTGKDGPLSERELEVLRLASQGLSNQEIAGRLVVATSTIKTHLNNIYVKLQVRNRAEAVFRAQEQGLI